MMTQYLQQRQIELNNNQAETKSPPPSSTESQRSKSTIAYKLFVHREELRNSQGRHLKLSKSKLNLTQGLVSYSVERITEYDVGELMNINRQISFTRKLQYHMNNMKQMQKIRHASQALPQKTTIRSSG